MHAGKEEQSKAKPSRAKGKQAQAQGRQGENNSKTDRLGRVRAVRRPQRMQTATVALEERLWGGHYIRPAGTRKPACHGGGSSSVQALCCAGLGPRQPPAFGAFCSKPQRYSIPSVVTSNLQSRPSPSSINPYHISVFPSNSIQNQHLIHKTSSTSIHPQSHVRLSPAFNSTISVSLPPLTAVFFPL